MRLLMRNVRPSTPQTAANPLRLDQGVLGLIYMAMLSARTLRPARPPSKRCYTLPNRAGPASTVTDAPPTGNLLGCLAMVAALHASGVLATNTVLPALAVAKTSLPFAQVRRRWRERWPEWRLFRAAHRCSARPQVHKGQLHSPSCAVRRCIVLHSLNYERDYLAAYVPGLLLA